METERGMELIAADARMVEVVELIAELAPTRLPVLIRGEIGTGKEHVARALHQRSPSSTLPFVVVRPAALPEGLLEPELFGFRRGALPGADADHEGRLAAARGGTVFVDEIALLPLAFQGQLVWVLEEQRVWPVGALEARPVDFRLLAATEKNLRQHVAQGSFRADLYHRLAVARLEIPPLRQRPADILPLARHFVTTYAQQTGFSELPRFSVDAREALLRYRWPGNVLELENTIRHALVVCRNGEIRAAHLSVEEEPQALGAVAEELSYEAGKRRVLAAYQRQAVERALSLSSGNVTHAARHCGLTRAAFQRLMRQLEVERASFDDER